MGAGLEVFSLEAPFLYLQRCEAFTDSCTDEETDKDVGPGAEYVRLEVNVCLCLWLQECVLCDECRLHGNSDQNGYTTTITPSPSPSLSQFHL